MEKPPIYGLMAMFENADDLLEASRKAYELGYRKMEAYTPFPVHGLPETIGFTKTRMPLLVLIGALTGFFTGAFMQYYSAVIDYPLNVGGRPYNSWPAFIPITFEMTVLFGAFAAVLGMLALNGLPQPYHPVFNVPSFELASRNHFFLCIEATDPKFDLQGTRQFMEQLEPLEVSEVEH